MEWLLTNALALLFQIFLTVHDSSGCVDYGAASFLDKKGNDLAIIAYFDQGFNRAQRHLLCDTQGTLYGCASSTIYGSTLHLRDDLYRVAISVYDAGHWQRPNGWAIPFHYFISTERFKPVK